MRPAHGAGGAPVPRDLRFVQCGPGAGLWPAVEYLGKDEGGCRDG